MSRLRRWWHWLSRRGPVDDLTPLSEKARVERRMERLHLLAIEMEERMAIQEERLHLLLRERREP